MVRVGILGICGTSSVLRILLSGFWVWGSQFLSLRDPFPASWVSGSQFHGPGCQGSVSQNPGSQSLRVPGPDFRLCLWIYLNKKNKFLKVLQKLIQPVLSSLKKFMVIVNKMFLYLYSTGLIALHYPIKSVTWDYWWSSFNNTHMEELDSVQKFIEIQGWLLLTFFICLHNQLSSFNSIIVQMSEKHDSSSRQ